MHHMQTPYAPVCAARVQLAMRFNQAGVMPHQTKQFLQGHASRSICPAIQQLHYHLCPLKDRDFLQHVEPLARAACALDLVHGYGRSCSCLFCIVPSATCSSRASCLLRMCCSPLRYLAAAVPCKIAVHLVRAVPPMMAAWNAAW